MSNDRPTRETMYFEEVTVSNMWEIATIVEILERKGLCTSRIFTTSSPSFAARIPEPASQKPEPYLLTETENTIIDDILALLNKHGLTSHQSHNLFEMGLRVAARATHLIIKSKNLN